MVSALVIFGALCVATLIIVNFFSLVSDTDHASWKTMMQKRRELKVDTLMGTPPDQEYLAASRKSYAAQNA